MEDRNEIRRQQTLFWLVAVAGLFLFLGKNALSGSEDRWAEITRAMLLTGDYWHPALNFDIYFDKPLLSYWVIVPFAKMLGGVSEFVIRVPSVLAGLLALWGVQILGRKLFNRQTALYAAWLMLGTYGFLFWGRTASADAANMAAIVLAVAVFFSVEDKPRFIDYLIFYLICFLGALTKGLPAVVMPLAIITPYLLLNWRWKKHIKFVNFAALLLAAGVFALVFYFQSTVPVAQMLKMPAGNLSSFDLLWRENITRVFDPFDHKDPAYTYLYNLPRLLLPWVLLIGVGIAALIANWKKLPDLVKMAMLGSLLMFVLYMISGSRRWYYILPMIPFCCLWGAAGLIGEYSIEKWTRLIILLARYLIIVLCSLGVVSVLALPLWHRFFDIKLPWLLIATLPAAGAIGLLIMLFDGYKNQAFDGLTGLPPRIAAVTLAGTLLSVAVFSSLMPALDELRTTRKFLIELKQNLEVTPADMIIVWGSDSSNELGFYWDLKTSVKEVNVADYNERLALFRKIMASGNSGSRVIVYTVTKHVDSFQKAARDLNLPLKSESGDFVEPSLAFEKKKARKLYVWVFNLK